MALFGFRVNFYTPFAEKSTFEIRLAGTERWHDDARIETTKIIRLTMIGTTIGRAIAPGALVEKENHGDDVGPMS